MQFSIPFLKDQTPHFFLVWSSRLLTDWHLCLLRPHHFSPLRAFLYSLTIGLNVLCTQHASLQNFMAGKKWVLLILAFLPSNKVTLEDSLSCHNFSLQKLLHLYSSTGFTENSRDLTLSIKYWAYIGDAY